MGRGEGSGHKRPSEPGPPDARGALLWLPCTGAPAMSQNAAWPSGASQSTRSPARSVTVRRQRGRTPPRCCLCDGPPPRPLALWHLRFTVLVRWCRRCQMAPTTRDGIVLFSATDFLLPPFPSAGHAEGPRGPNPHTRPGADLIPRGPEPHTTAPHLQPNDVVKGHMRDLHSARAGQSQLPTGHDVLQRPRGDHVGVGGGGGGGLFKRRPQKAVPETGQQLRVGVAPARGRQLGHFTGVQWQVCGEAVEDSLQGRPALVVRRQPAGGGRGRQAG